MAARTVNFLVFKNDAPTLACMLKRLLSAFFSLFFLGAASGTSFAEVTVPDALKDRIALKKTARQLNIVYFLGSDTEPVPDYERRLSELLLYLCLLYTSPSPRD